MFCYSDADIDSSGKIKVVVTGGCGSLGREIIRQLIATNRYAVHCLDLFIPPKDKRIAGVVSYIQTDIVNFSDVSRAFQGMEVVFHTASMMPMSILNTSEAMERVNVKGTKNVIQACQQCGIKRLIYTSSTTVILNRGTNYTKLLDESAPFPKEPLNAYVRTKGEAERAVRDANDEDGLRTCALRLGGILGRDSYIMKSFMQNTPIVGKGDFIFGWTSLTSAGEVHLLVEHYLAEKSVSSDTNVFNVISINSKYNEMKSCFSIQNTGKEPAQIPIWLCKALIFFNEISFWFAGLTPLGPEIHRAILEAMVSNPHSTERAEKELGWADKRPLKQIVSDCIAEYKQNLDH